ncbi:hypothetical protein F5Y19DRAFT_231570 [Xylariaceae sp. FL1651]|nr:hypothetical protein F5Y19DRAFT_231570 [Xylariaceae sp. FL1651]
MTRSAMTTYYPEGEAKATSPAVLAAIDNVDIFARKLYRRARNAGSDFENVAVVVRGLHTVLKHLKVEAEDAESLLNSDSSTVYTRQLTPIIEDAEFTLKQLDTILEKYFGGSSNGPGIGNDGERRVRMNDSDKGWTMLDSGEIEKIELIRTKLANQKLNIDMFLDTVQLHNPSKSHRMVDTTSTDLDVIKDKVDSIASRLCQRKDSGFRDNDDQLWEQFRDALEEEGFSKDVLRKNQDVLRAYIRQLDEQTTAFGGSTPSVRGFLEYYNPMMDSSRSAPAYPAYPAPAELDEEDLNQPNINNEKFFPSMKMERLAYDEYPAQPVHLAIRDTGLSYDHQSSDDQTESLSDSMALISTRDLMALDKKSADLAIAMGNMHIHDTPPTTNENYITAGYQSQRYLPSSSSQPALLTSSDRSNAIDERYEYEYDPPPRYVPSLPPPPLGGDRSPPPTLHSSSISAPSVIGEQQALAPPVLSPSLSDSASTCQRFARLGPDSQGREIPLEAKWTRIRRTLVSPQVLAQEGLRYEARPDFVAVLGELTREAIADLAKKSAEVRNERQKAMSNAPGGTTQARHNRRQRRAEDRYHPDKYRNWDVIEGQQERNGGPGYVIDPHDRYRTNSTDSSTSELWDSSDDEASEGLYENQDALHQYPSSYPPPSHANSSPYYHSFGSRSGPNKETASVSDDGGDKGTKAYPFIVPPPKQEGKAGDSHDKTSPSSTVKPKPILKNKNDDPHVRFDPEPQVFDESSGSVPRSINRRDKERDTSERDYRDRERDKVRTQDKDREKKYRSERYLDRERHSDRHNDRDREREHRRHGGSSKYQSGTSSGRRGDRDENSSRRVRDDRDRDRGSRKKARSETLRAVGIGGAAASLLSVLTEAAAGL